MSTIDGKRLGVIPSRLGTFGAVFFMITAAILLLGRFGWPGGSTSWTGSIRFSLLPVLLIGLSIVFIRRPNLSFLHFAFLAFMGYLAFNSLIVADSSQYFRRTLIVCAFALGVSLIIDRQHYWKWLMAVMVVLGAVLAGLSLFNSLEDGQFSLAYREAGLDRSGIPGVADFGNTIVAGMHYALCLIAGVWLALSTRSRRVSACWFLCVLILAVYIYFTYARTSWIACIVGCGILILRLADRRTLKWVGIAAVVGVALVVTVGYEALSYELHTRGLTHRDDVWREVISRMSGDWLFGHGGGTALGEVSIAGGAQIVHNTHNLYLEILYQFGVVGLALALLVMASAGWTLYRGGKGLASLWLATLGAVSVVMLVELNSFVGAPNPVWLWFWLPVGGAMAFSTRQQHAEA